MDAVHGGAGAGFPVVVLDDEGIGFVADDAGDPIIGICIENWKWVSIQQVREILG